MYIPWNKHKVQYSVRRKMIIAGGHISIYNTTYLWLSKRRIFFCIRSWCRNYGCLKNRLKLMMKYFIMTVWNWYRPLSISRPKDSVPTVFLRGLFYPSDCGSDSCWGSDNEVGVCHWFTVWHWMGGLILNEGSDTDWEVCF